MKREKVRDKWIMSWDKRSVSLDETAEQCRRESLSRIRGAWPFSTGQLSPVRGFDEPD